MIRWLNAVLVLFLFLSIPCYGQKIEYTKRSKNEVREGPGNYYPLLYILPTNTSIEIIKKQGGWIRFSNVNKQIIKNLPDEGRQSDSWISKNCLVKKAPRKPLKELQFLGKSLVASPSSVAAAIRGYAERYGKVKTTTLDSLINFQKPFFTPQEYLEFKDETSNIQNSSGQKKLAKRFKSYFRDYDITVAEEGIGFGIAARISGRGLLDNPQLLKYVNLLGTFLIESTGAYDYPFKIFILQDAGLTAFSIPGGYIFISERLIAMCRDEAELAGIIAHEMIHVLLKHGLEEMQQRIMKIRMDMAFQELDKEVSEEYDELEAELEDFANEAYETIVKPRLLKYEDKADQGAVVFLAKAGYDPKGVPRTLLRIRKSLMSDEELEMENPFAQLDYKTRYNQVTKFINRNLAKFKGVTNTERFLSNTKR